MGPSFFALSIFLPPWWSGEAASGFQVTLRKRPPCMGISFKPSLVDCCAAAPRVIPDQGAHLFRKQPLWQFCLLQNLSCRWTKVSGAIETTPGFYSVLQDPSDNTGLFSSGQHPDIWGHPSYLFTSLLPPGLSCPFFLGVLFCYISHAALLFPRSELKKHIHFANAFLNPWPCLFPKQSCGLSMQSHTKAEENIPKWLTPASWKIGWHRTRMCV